MIIHQEELMEELTIGDSDSIEVGIDMDNISFIMELVSTKFYSNPIGSIVREITSNCWDANKESGSDKSVIIKITPHKENSDEYTIDFIDNGFGITKDRLVNIYSQWFSSNKRGTNELIGGFGLGSKSPLAYSDFFYIETRCEGYKTKYLLSKNKGSKPNIEVLSKVEYQGDTGTTISIDIRSSQDRWKFENAIDEQLHYFDNVYIDSIYYSKHKNIYTIYDCETFKYRGGSSGEIHLLLGNVKYPIDYNIINQGYNSSSPEYFHRLNIPVGIKFEIGEILVTPNRESIEYREESILLIRERIKATIEELKAIFIKQNPVYNNLKEYLIAKDSKPNIRFSNDHILNVDGLSVNKDVIFQPCPEIKNLSEVLFEYEEESIQNNKLKKRAYTYTTHNSDIIDGTLERYYFSDRPLDKYSNILVRDGIVLRKKDKGLRTIFKEYSDELKLKPRKRQTHNWYKAVSNDQYEVVRRPTLGIAKKIYNLRKLIKDYLLTNCREYPTPSEEWIRDYKIANRIDYNGAKERRANRMVILYDTYGKNAKEISINDLSKSHIVFFAMKDSVIDMDNLRQYEKLLSDNNYSFNLKGRRKYKEGKVKPDVPVFAFYSVNKTNYPYISKLKNVKHINKFFSCKALQPFFNKVVLNQLWKESMNTYYDFARNTCLNKVNSDLKTKILKLYGCFRSINNSLDEELFEKLKKIPVKNHYRTLEIRKIKKEVDKEFPKYAILEDIKETISDENLKRILNEFKELKTIKLNKKLWQLQKEQN